MENSSTEKTPMGKVWLLVLFSMCLTLAVSLMWHFNGMKSKDRSDKLENEALIANTARIAAYRDVLKEKGQAGAAAYLETLASE